MRRAKELNLHRFYTEHLSRMPQQTNICLLSKLRKVKDSNLYHFYMTSVFKTGAIPILPTFHLWEQMDSNHLSMRITRFTVPRLPVEQYSQFLVLMVRFELTPLQILSLLPLPLGYMSICTTSQIRTDTL